MPGGSAAAWEYIKPIFQAICAKTQDNLNISVPCCDWVGSGGAGHFVKMVQQRHRIRRLQLICEAYQLLADCLGLSIDELSAGF
jgi:6-phosphogluconate dehydrogenase